MSKSDGMYYAPKSISKPVCEKGDFKFAAIGLDHGHIYGMCSGLVGAGGKLTAVYDQDPDKIKMFLGAHPDIKVAKSADEILEDQSVHMVASAIIPNERGPLGLRVLDHGKHYMSDKAPFTTFKQLEKARQKVQETQLIWSVCYSERLLNESAIFAGQLIEQGAIGDVIQVIGTGPHRLGKADRPDWFFKKECYGGILCDIGSHQIEQFLYYGKVKSAKVVHSKVANYKNSDYPEFEDFGDATLVGDNGVTNYFRVDWFTPEALPVWGDGRTTILGSEGYIELRKYINITQQDTANHVYLVNNEEEKHYEVDRQVGFPFFGKLVLDCLNQTETAMPQVHTFLAAQLCLEAQAQAVKIK
jgi:predicted dehydrogenase